jgi:twitching motility protein PilT
VPIAQSVSGITPPVSSVRSIDELLEAMVSLGASDLHITAGTPPAVRVHGELHRLEGVPVLSPEMTQELLYRVLSTEQQKQLEIKRQIDTSHSMPGLARFRLNVYFQRGALGAAFRVIPEELRTLGELGLPVSLADLAMQPRGLVLVTGPTGSGKSTTLAAMIDQINDSRARHIVTLEDPIEYLHRDKLSIINQREVGQDTESFARAMRRVLRQDPDVILVGEMRDEETVRTALSAAETGHLVLSTLHTMDATETVNRIIDFFPPHLQQQARVMLAATLRGVVGQRLVQRVGGQGRVAICEVLVVTGRVQDLILNPEETGRITEVISEGEYYGMQTFDQALLKHVMAGTITEETAMDAATSPHDFKLMLQAQGQRASGIEQVLGNA